MPHSLALPEIVEAPPADDPFRYGTRYSRRRMPDGTYELLRLPLTLWDVLHPQEGDHITKCSRHTDEVAHLANAIRALTSRDKHCLVLSNCAVHWDTPGLSHHAPDIAVVFHVEDNEKEWPCFSVKNEGVSPSIIIEVVSPHTRSLDAETKFAEYHTAGVPLYVLIDREANDSWPTIRAYQYSPEGYEPLPADEQGRFLLQPIGLFLGTKRDRLALVNARTGQEMADYATMYQTLQAARGARREAEEAARKAEEDLRQIKEATRAAKEAARADREATRRERQRTAEIEREVRELRDKLQGDHPLLTPPPGS